MFENLYTTEIVDWYDRIMEAGYNPQDHKNNALSLIKILGNRKKVIELGAGTGLLLEQLKNLEMNVSGFDFSEDMVHKAKKRLGENVPLYHQDVLELNLPDNYQVALSMGGVWVAVEGGSYMDSHITGYQRNLQGLKNVANHLDSQGLLILNIGPDQKDGQIQLSDGATYSQKVSQLDNGTYKKDYFIKKEGIIVAQQHCEYARFSLEETLSLMQKAGFNHKKTTDSVVIYQKN